eukprot:PhM_4_TR3282/c0_g1_i1/m.2344
MSRPVTSAGLIHQREEWRQSNNTLWGRRQSSRSSARALQEDVNESEASLAALRRAVEAHTTELGEITHEREVQEEAVQMLRDDVARLEREVDERRRERLVEQQRVVGRRRQPVVDNPLVKSVRELEEEIRRLISLSAHSNRTGGENGEAEEDSTLMYNYLLIPRACPFDVN